MVVDIAKGTVAVIGCGLAFYALGTAIAVAGGLLGALLSPLGLVAAGIAALVVTTPELSASFMSTFGEVQSIASTTMTGIYDAISGGDLGGAMDIAMTGLMAAWQTGTADLQSAFVNWSTQFQNGFTDLGTGIAVAWEHMWSQIAQTANWWNVTLSNDEVKKRNDAIQANTDRSVSAMETENSRVINERTAGAKAFGDNLRTSAAASQEKLATLTSTARDRRILSGQGENVINAVGEAKTMDELRTLADEFFALRDTGMLTDSQQKKYGEAVDKAAEKLTPTAISGIAEASPGAIKPPDQDALLKAAAEAAKQVETQGTFSSVNLGGMGFGSTIAERQLKALEGIQKNTEQIGEEGAVAA
jgi:hypothetical protein